MASVIRLTDVQNFVGYDKDVHLRKAVAALSALIHDRIHVRGIASDGNPIGTYSEGYMVVRTGRYKNAVLFKKGEKKGFVKNPGTFTKGGADTVGFGAKGFERKPRVNYNRSDDPKVIISLTRQLENDYGATNDNGVEATNGGYGIGFSNPHNYDKSQWVEETYNKDIFAPTNEEVDFITEYLADLITGNAD